MKIAYLDCFAGISGDMFLGALVDAGLNLDALKLELKKLHLPPHDFSVKKVVRKHIQATKVKLSFQDTKKYRNLNDILNILRLSDGDPNIIKSAEKIFFNLAEVEAHMHNKKIEEIHFHEVGAMDTIIDVVGVLTGLKILNIQEVHVSKIHTGTGFVNCQHGTLPIPAPATFELLKDIPVYSTGIEAELVTPTGAVLIKNIAKSFGILPSMIVKNIGYGAGDHDLPIPNLLRIVVGEINSELNNRDQVVLLETNIDDMNSEIFPYVSQKLMTAGALDVYMTPITMKKGRPGIILSVLTPIPKQQDMLSILFSETTSLGVRINKMERCLLKREILTISTSWGQVDVKIAKEGDVIKNIAPEYETCRKIAQEQGIPLKQVYDDIKRLIPEIFKNSTSELLPQEVLPLPTIMSEDCL